MLTQPTILPLLYRFYPRYSVNKTAFFWQKLVSLFFLICFMIILVSNDLQVLLE